MVSAQPLYTSTDAYRTLFGGLARLNLLTDADAVCFDGDFTLLEYKVRAHQKMQYTVSAQVMIKKRGYPPEYAHITDEDLDFPMDGVVMDGNTGCVVKLAPDRKVLRAYRGSHPLTPAEV